jgi:hypothetical protein
VACGSPVLCCGRLVARPRFNRAHLVRITETNKTSLRGTIARENCIVPRLERAQRRIALQSRCLACGTIHSFGDIYAFYFSQIDEERRWRHRHRVCADRLADLGRRHHSNGRGRRQGQQRTEQRRQRDDLSHSEIEVDPERCRKAHQTLDDLTTGLILRVGLVIGRDPIFHDVRSRADGARDCFAVESQNESPHSRFGPRPTKNRFVEVVALRSRTQLSPTPRSFTSSSLRAISQFTNPLISASGLSAVNRRSPRTDRLLRRVRILAAEIVGLGCEPSLEIAESA